MRLGSNESDNFFLRNACMCNGDGELSWERYVLRTICFQKLPEADEFHVIKEVILKMSENNFREKVRILRQI